MKRVTFRSLEPQARFEMDDQPWIKVDGVTAQHAFYDVPIDMEPSAKVFIKVAVPTPTTTRKHDDGSKKIRKREGFLLVLGTLLESFNWF
ncbi:hypothetical protein [Pseudomonas sp. DSV-1]|uniref:hypothetical protein n=1 Tax=Pseudomonas sp. DSV-1 TaxID=3112250 RepID=UPI002DBB22D1|nr:hypothetical protein [Pseudomonas sp. DSV-1]MEC4242136.1 hypothetical protein [Pseudomonas sp. DSV-1]